MYCSHCGKKVGDAMLFCPFCGEPIVIPEQDAPVSEALPVEEAPSDSELESRVAKAPAQEPAAEEPEKEDRPESTTSEDAAAELLDWSRERQAHVDEWARRDESEEEFSPLQLDDEDPAVDWREEIEQKKRSVVLEKKPPQTRRGEDNPVRLEGSAPKLELDIEGAKGTGVRKASRKQANTLVPPKTLDPEDIFMDEKPAAYDDDEYDPYDDAPEDDFTDAFIYEDEGESSFFMRHLRGIVGLALFLILILMFVIYAFSKPGQATLARANLAWSAEAYSTLGYQSYQAGQYSQAGLFYERALQRDANNYSFASSAAMGYFEAGDTDKSAAMLKRCVEIDPSRLEPYVYLLRLYPDAASRPWDVTQLLQQGYQMTGDTRLNVTG